MRVCVCVCMCVRAQPSERSTLAQLTYLVRVEEALAAEVREYSVSTP